MSEKTSNDCPELNPLEADLNYDNHNKECDPQFPSKKNVDFFQNPRKKEGLGREANSDPMTFGNIVDDFKKDPQNLSEPWMASYIPRYSKAKRACDEAVKNLFEDLVVINDAGEAKRVPITWATQERAVAALIQKNVRKDETTVVERIPLPYLAIYDSDFSINAERYTYHYALNYHRDKNRKPGVTDSEKAPKDTIYASSRGIPVDIGYTLYAWTWYKEDMNQILEQIVLKFSPIAYIKVQGVTWESIVKLESIANNENIDPGATNLRVIKWQFNLKAETYIPQPIVRQKSILETRVDIQNEVIENEVGEILTRLNSSTKDKYD